MSSMIGKGIAGTNHDFYAWNDSGQVWDATASSGAGAYVSLVDGNAANYRLAATDAGGGVFVRTIAAPAGMVFYELRIRGAAVANSPAVWTGVPDAASIDPRGPGADLCTQTINNTTTNEPIADADVWISTDAAGSNVITGPLQTNSDGEVTFLLDAGVTYYLWMQKDGVDSIEGKSFTAVAD